MKLFRPLAAVLAAFFVLALTACKPATVVMDTAAVGALLANLDENYATAESVVARNWDHFDTGERQHLETVQANLGELSAAMHRLVQESGGVGEALVQVDTVARLYGQARESYISAREIIAPRLEQLPPGDRSALERYDRIALRLDARMTELLNAPDGTNVTREVTDALSLAATAARLVGAAL